MITFYQGTLDTVMERLGESVSNFDGSWLEKCVPAAEEQIQQFENICSQYGYRLPKVYLDYLRTMGKNDSGLLEREWDGFAEPNISRILELFEEEDSDAREALQRGLLLFLYHCIDMNCYLDISKLEENPTVTINEEENPIVTIRESKYFAESFEKYLFQKAFKIYQHQFQYCTSIGTSIHSFDAILKKYACPCSVYGGTTEERRNFARGLAERFSMDETWFGDKVRYFSYDTWYALEIDIWYSFRLNFSCDDPMLKKQADSELEKIFHKLY